MKTLNHHLLLIFDLKIWDILHNAIFRPHAHLKKTCFIKLVCKTRGKLKELGDGPEKVEILPSGWAESEATPVSSLTCIITMLIPALADSRLLILYTGWGEGKHQTCTPILSWFHKPIWATWGERWKTVDIICTFQLAEIVEEHPPQDLRGIHTEVT